MRRVWPFKPLTPVVESLEWATDVFRAKAAEQRIALRTQPRRSLSFAHFLRDKEAIAAQNLIRASQADGGFYVPDWPQAVKVGSVTAGAGVTVASDLSSYHYGDRALLWDSISSYEVLDITWDSSGVTADVTNNYSNAMLMPLWEGNAPEALSVARNAFNQQSAQVSFILSESEDIGSSAYPTYRGHDVVTDCPVIGGGSIEESTSFETSTFNAVSGQLEFIRARSEVEFTSQMRWLPTSNDEEFNLRQFFHSRRGRQKAFWLSSNGADLEFSSTAGTTLTAFNDVLFRSPPFDIEVRNPTPEYRQVTATAVGTPVNGRKTVDMTLDSALSSSDVSRISILTCFRFDADRIEIEHNAGDYSRISVPLREVPVP